MKNQVGFILILGLLVLIINTSCQNHINKNELFKKIDGFVENMDYRSYSVNPRNTELTKSGEYRVTPLGRMIIVKIERNATEAEYEKLKRKIARRYKRNKVVREVYINQSGTIVIDCR